MIILFCTGQIITIFIIFGPSDQFDSLIGVITFLTPLWLVRLSVTQGKSEISRCAIGCNIFYEMRQIGLFFPIVSFHMSPQIVQFRGCIIALVAFVWLFSTMCFQMCPQITCTRGCIIALVALVWLFSTVRFQMCPQMACLKGRKVT